MNELVPLLYKLPAIVLAWTSITLAWGVYVGIVYTTLVYKARTAARHMRKCDIPHLWVLHIVNILLLSYIWSPLIYEFMGNSTIIVNIFYDLMLLASTLEILRWTKVKHTIAPTNTPDTVYIAYPAEKTEPALIASHTENSLTL